jgi:chromosome partitioning protein
VRYGASGAQPHVYDALSGECVMKSMTRATDLRYLHLVPSGRDLYGAEIELVSAINRERRLERALSEIRDAYEIVLLDCPPSLGLLTLNALTAADAVIIRCSASTTRSRVSPACSRRSTSCAAS